MRWPVVFGVGVSLLALLIGESRRMAAEREVLAADLAASRIEIVRMEQKIDQLRRTVGQLRRGEID